MCYSVNELGDPHKLRYEARPVGQQAPSVDPFTEDKDGRDPLPKCEVRDLRAIPEEKRRCRHDQHTAMIRRYVKERPLVVIGWRAQLNSEQAQADRGGGILRRLPLIGRQPIPEHRRGRHVWKRIPDELNPFHSQLGLLKENAGNVAGGTR